MAHIESKQEAVELLHAALLDAWKLIGRYRGRYMPTKGTGVAHRAAQRVLRDTQKFVNVKEVK